MITPRDTHALANYSTGSILGDTIVNGTVNTLDPATWVSSLFTSASAVKSGASTLANTALTGIAKSLENAILYAVSPIIVLVLSIIIPIATVFVWLMGMFMDGALIMNLHIADIVNSVGAINSMWSIVRDSMSIIIIFVLLYASITMIVGLNEQKIKTLLVRVVLAGLLINFSLFFTKLIIDASNIIAIYIYNQIAVTPLTSGGTFSTWWNMLANGTGLSYTLMKGLYLQNTLVPAVQGLLTGDALANMTIGMIMSTVMMTLAGFSFLVAAIILFMRLFYLIMLMAFSPIWWIGLVLPQISDYSKKWSKLLIGECMVAPIYLVFLYFAVMFMSSTALTGGTSSNALVSAAQSAIATTNITGFFNTGTLAVFFKFMIGIFLINASIIAAKSFGSASGETGSKFYGWLKKTTSDSLQKTAAFAARNTAGAAAAKYRETPGFREFAANNPILGGIASGALGSISSASWGGKKGGFDAQREADEKSRKKLFKNIGTVNRADYASDEEFHKAEERAVELQGRYKDNLQEMRKDPISHFLGVDRSGYALENDYNANYGKVHGDEIEKIINENKAEIEKIKDEISEKRKAEFAEVDTKHKADIEEIDNALKSDLARLGSKYSDKTKEEVENIRKSMEKEVENTKKSIETKWDNESKTREAPFQKKIADQSKYSKAAADAKKQKELEDAVAKIKDSGEKSESKKEPKSSEPKP